VPCEKCGTDRIVTKQKILCPKCDKVTGIDVKKAIDSRKNELQKTLSFFKKEIKMTHYNQTFGSAVLNRELAAKAIIYSPRNRSYAVTEWFAYSFLLKNLKYLKNNGRSNFPTLLNLSRKIVSLNDEISCLTKGLAVIIKNGDQEDFVFTEKEPLSFVPDEAHSDSEDKISKTALFGKNLHADIVMFQEGLMSQIQTVILSEEISQILRKTHHSRLLYFVNNSSKASKFVEISFNLAKDGLNQNISIGVDETVQGIKIIYNSDLRKLKNALLGNFQSDDINWYFENLLNNSNQNMFDFFNAIIVKDEQLNTISLPLFSLLMLGYATIKWMDDSDVGRALNLKGGTVEDFFLRFLSGYDICLEHPITGDKLIRVKHPDQPIEIADLMGYNSDNVLVLESKFWNVPILSKLEEEIEKFEKKVDFISGNLQKFGLNKNLNVIPIFYTPYAPYKKKNKILIFPTAISVGTKIGTVFGLRKIELLKKFPDLDKLFELIKYPLPFRIDAASLLENVPENKFGINDAVVWEYDKEELTVFIDTPVSVEAGLVYLDLTEGICEKLKQEKINRGDILRIITADLNGAWSLIQLIDFRKIVDKSEWVSNPEKALGYERMLSLFNYMEKSHKNNNK